MLSLTPEVERALRTFELTHTLRQTATGGWEWHQTALPEEGGVLDQTGRVMDELAFILSLKQEILVRTLQEQVRDQARRHRR